MNKKKVIVTVLLIVFLLVVVVFAAYSGKSNDPKSEDFDWEAAEKKAANKMFPGIEFGGVIKEIKDPEGNTISIIKDATDGAIVDLSHLSKKAADMTKNSKHISDEEIYHLNATDDQKKAIESVINYITMGGVSQGTAASEFFIRDALAYRGYDPETIEYALTHAGVDWDEQAYIQTLILLSKRGISKKDLIDTIIEMGFSEEVATREASREDIDYYEQAVAYASHYRFEQEVQRKINSNYMKYEKKDVKKMLQRFNFTDKEIKYAVNVVFDKIKAELDD